MLFFNCCMNVVFFYTWVHVALSLWRVHVRGKKDQWLKVGSGSTPAFHWMNIWLKRCLSTLSQRLLCFKASRHNIRGGGGQNGQCSSLTATLSLPIFFSFLPLFALSFPSLPSIYLSLFFLCSLSVWMLPFCRKAPFMSPLIAACAFCLSLYCLCLYEEKCFYGLQHHYCHR